MSVHSLPDRARAERSEGLHVAVRTEAGPYGAADGRYANYREIYSSHMRFPGDPSQKSVKALLIIFHLEPGRRARGCELR